MNQEDLNTSLYNKMAQEQETYRAWLLKQPRRKFCATPMSTQCGRIF